MVGDELELRLHRRAVGVVAADGQDWHAQTAPFGKECPVLLRIPRKRRELAAEGVVNGAGPCIQHGVVVPSVLVDRGRTR